MITLSVLNDRREASAFYEKSGIIENENSCCLVAKQGENIEGYCLFDIDKERITVRFIDPLKDLFLADGILRSALHVAAERFILKAYYADTVPEDFFRKLGFIKNKEDKTLDIDKLFKSCQSCKKED